MSPLSADARQDHAAESEEMAKILSTSAPIIKAATERLAQQPETRAILKKRLEEQADKGLPKALQQVVGQVQAEQAGVQADHYRKLLIDELNRQDVEADKINNKLIGMFRGGSEAFRQQIYDQLDNLTPAAVLSGKERSDQIKNILAVIGKEAASQGVPAYLVLDEFQSSLVLLKQYQDSRNQLKTQVASFMDEDIPKYQRATSFMDADYNENPEAFIAENFDEDVITAADELTAQQLREEKVKEPEEFDELPPAQPSQPDQSDEQISASWADQQQINRDATEYAKQLEAKMKEKDSEQEGGRRRRGQRNAGRYKRPDDLAA